MWIARDKNGELYLYPQKPIKNEEWGVYSENTEAEGIFMIGRDVMYSFIQLDANLYPEVTWENSPKELVIKM